MLVAGVEVIRRMTFRWFRGFSRSQSRDESRSSFLTSSGDFSSHTLEDVSEKSTEDANDLGTHDKLTFWTNSSNVDSLESLCENRKNLTELRIIGVDNEAGRNLEKIPSNIINLSQLMVLDVHSSHLGSFPLPVLQLESLKSLHLSYCGISEVPDDIRMLKNLVTLSLDANEITKLPSDLYSLKKLEELYLSKNGITEIATEIDLLDKLQRLDLSENELKIFPMGITKLKLLTKLLLAENDINELPSDIGEMNCLTYLDISTNSLLSIPSSIGKLTTLKYLKLANNFITCLPKEIVELKLRDDAFLVENNRLQVPPQEVCENGLQTIKAYFEAKERHPQFHNKRLKFVLLGETTAGKSSLASALYAGKDGCVKQDNRTVQMDFYTWRARPDKDDLEVLIVDCAGQRKYLLTYHFFLSEGCLYGIVVDLNSYEKSDKSFKTLVWDWTESVLSKVPDGTILIVGTHRDLLKPEEVYDKCCDIVSRNKKFIAKRDIDVKRPGKGPYFTTVVADFDKEGRCSEKTDLEGELQLVPLSGIKDLFGVQDLREEIYRIVDHDTVLPNVNQTLPSSWADFEKHIFSCRKEKNKALARQALIEKAEEYDLYESSAEAALKYFDSIGSISYFHHSVALSKHIIVDPSWLPSVLKDLFRLDLKASCPYNNNFMEYGAEDSFYGEGVFNNDIRNLVNDGKLRKRLLRCIWHEWDVDDNLFAFLVSLLEHFGLVAKVPTSDILLVPWFFSDHPRQEVIEKYWPTEFPTDHLQILAQYEIYSPYDIVAGLFDRFAIRNHDHEHCFHWKNGFALKKNTHSFHCHLQESKTGNRYVVWVKGRCKKNSLRELWLFLLNALFEIRILLKEYQGIRYGGFCVCPERSDCDHVFEVKWFDPSFTVNNFCSNARREIPLEQLRPPRDVLIEHLYSRPGVDAKDPFERLLTTDEKYVIANNIGELCKDFGEALGLGASEVSDICKQYQHEPVEMVIQILNRQSQKCQCGLELRDALRALRKMKSVPEYIIDKLLDLNP